MTASLCFALQQPDMAGFQALLAPVATQMMAAAALTEGKRTDVSVLGFSF